MKRAHCQVADRKRMLNIGNGDDGGGIRRYMELRTVIALVLALLGLGGGLNATLLAYQKGASVMQAEVRTSIGKLATGQGVILRKQDVMKQCLNDHLKNATADQAATDERLRDQDAQLGAVRDRVARMEGYAER